MVAACKKKKKLIEIAHDELDTSTTDSCSSTDSDGFSFQIERGHSVESNDNDDDVQGDGSRTDKKVTFALSRNQFVTSNMVITIDEMEASWWTRNDLEVFRTACSRTVLLNASKTMDAVQFVYDACAKMANATLTAQKAVGCVRDCIELCGSPIRGLECNVHPSKMSDKAVAQMTILRTQAKLPAMMSSSQRQEILAATSRVLSHQSRQMAQVLAIGDADVARRVYRDDGSNGSALDPALDPSWSSSAIPFEV